MRVCKTWPQKLLYLRPAERPAFGILPAELDTLLAANFEPIKDAAVDDSLLVFSSRERWQVSQWR